MSMSDEEWGGVKKDSGRIFRRGVLFAAVVVVLVAVFSIAHWGFGVGTSDVKGQGDAAKTKNSGVNRILKQEEFNKRYQDILATDRKIDPAKKALDADPKNSRLQTEYIGLVNYCISAAGEYNSLARQYTAQQFRDVDLPEKIDDTNPLTDCEETKK